MKRLLSLALVFALALSAAACAGTPAPAASPGPQDPASSQATPAPAASVTPAPSAAAPVAPPDDSKKDYVSDTPVNLTIWASINGKGYEGMANFNEIWSFQEIEKMSNVNITWEHPPVGQEKEQFNLILAAQEYPDMIYHTWMTSYPGGPDKAIADGVIVKLNDYMTQETSPNLTALYGQHPTFRKNSITDTGSFYMYPFVRGYCLFERTEWAIMFTGPQYRMDWAQALNIAEPDTIEDWHNFLVAVRDGDPNGNGQKDEIPLVSPAKDLNNWVSPFGTLAGFCLKDGKLTYGYLEPEFKDYLTTMSQWFSEGLIDKDYLVTDGNMFKTKVVTNIGGAYIGGIGGNFGGITQAFEEEYGDKDVLMAAKWPKNADGKRYTTENTKKTLGMDGGLAIMTSNKFPQESAKFCDLAFREDMYDMLNFGQEGVHFTKGTDGSITISESFKQEMRAAKDMNTVVAKVAVAAINGWATFMHPDYYLLQYTIRNQSKAAEIWNDWGAGLTDELVLPRLTITVEEAAIYTNLMAEITTYVDETKNKIIMGEMPVSEWDRVIEELNKRGIQQAIDIQAKAYERYNAR